MLNRIRNLHLKLMAGRDSIVKRQVGKYIMHLDLKDEGISSSLINKKIDDPEREAAFMKILRKEISPGMVAVDIGANIGYVTLVMADLVGSLGSVYAIEPHPRNFSLLLRNIEANGYMDRVFPFQLGISNNSGTSKFHVSGASNLHSILSSPNTEDVIDIVVLTLDDFLGGKDYPDFVKMDIEGHEVEALDGMFTVLKNSTKTTKILMEVHPMYYTEDRSLEIQLRRLLEIGFSTKYVISAGIARPDFFKRNGYEPDEVIFTDGWYRGIYSNVTNEHMIMAACHVHEQFIEQRNIHSRKVVRSIMIEKQAAV